MSYFRVALRREAERRQLSQMELARQCGLSKSYISRLMGEGGESATLSNDVFAAILGAFSADKRAQAELVMARCMDARVGPGSEFVELKIQGAQREAGVEVSAVSPEIELGREAERAFQFLRKECVVNEDLEKHLISYAKLMGME